MRIRLSVIVICVLAIAQSLFAVPARRGWKDYLTDKGESVSLQMIGDEFGHWLEDRDGVAYVLMDDGTVVLSEKTAEQLSQLRKSSPRYLASRPHRTAGNINLAPRGIVILVNYANLSMKAANTQAAFNNMMNQAGYNYRNTHNSVREYFREQSRGQYVPDFDVYGPVTIKNNYSYYGSNVGGVRGEDKYPGDIVVEAVKAVDEQYEVDFSLYNNDGDDEIDFVYVIYAGKGEANGGTAATIWPHNWDLYSARYFGNCTYSEDDCEVDGLYINNYAMSGELDASGYRSSIGTICHEFGHVLGLPDLYDTSYGNNYSAKTTPWDWDIMDYGSYSGVDSNGNEDAGTCPPNYSPFERIYLGWDTPVNPGKTPSNLVLYPAEHSDYKCYQINASGEYQVCTTTGLNYYIENRQQTGWDTYLPGHGMLVWKMNYNATYWSANEPNLSDHGAPHYTLVSANGTQIPSGANTYPGTQNVTEWTSLASRPVTSIAESGGIVTAAYMGGAVERYSQELAYYVAVNNETAGKDGDYSVYLYDAGGTLFAVAEIYTQDNYSLSGTFPIGVDGGGEYNSQIYLNGQFYEVTSGEISFQYVGKSSDNEDIYKVTATDWYIPSLRIICDMSGIVYGNAVWKTPFVECSYSTSCDGVIIDTEVAVDHRCGDNLTWELSSDNKVLTIEGYGDMWDFTLTSMTDNTIPWSYAYTTIEQVILPQGITGIGDYAFFNHRQLTTISLPSSLTRIGAYAFARNAFPSITIPEAVTQIGDYAFAVTPIASIGLPENLANIGTDVFYNCTALRTVNYNAANCQIPDNYDTGNPFYSVRSQITAFNFGSEVQVLPAGLCYKMTNLASVTLPLSLTTLNGNVFNGCSKLTSITIPKNMNYIGKDAFAYCTQLTTVVWNAKTCALAGTNTANTPFRNICGQITSFTIGDDVQELPIGCCFGMEKLSSVTIPAQLSSIGVYCFHTCSSLKTVRFNRLTPPSAHSSAFTGIPDVAVAEVPCGARLSYEASTLPFSTYNTYGDFIYTVTLAVQTPETGSVGWLLTPDCDNNSGVIKATPGVHYHFLRWEDEAENVATVGPERSVVVTEDVTYTAVFEADPVCVITVYNDGHGSAGADKRSYYAGETATLTATPDDGYDFLQWSDGNKDNPRTLTVTQDITLTAEFVRNSYTVTFVNFDGSELQSSTVRVGEMPTYTSDEPVKPADNYFTYTFIGWDKDIVPVTGDAVYTAVYSDEERLFTLTWQYIDDFNQQHEDVGQYTYGQEFTPPYPYAHRSDGYHYYFTGWLLNGEGEPVIFANHPTVDGDKVFVAAYEEVRMYEITFYDNDGTTVLQTVWCDENALPAFTNPTPAKDGMVFAGWDRTVVLAEEATSYAATYAAAEAAGDALQGGFSVSGSKKVRFAKGNLQYDLAEDSWSLAHTQYDIIGLPNINLGDENFHGTIDMFAYSTEITNYGVSPSNADADYTGDFRDWGQLIGDGWFTLTKDEWVYLYSRKGGSLWGSAMVVDRKGLILLPDDWQLPEGLEFTPKYRVDDYEIEDFEKNKYTLDEWKRMEAAGAVFLPAAGRRTGGIGNTMNGANEATFVNPATGYYSFMDNTDIFGYYWSSTATSEKNASYLIFNGASNYQLPAVWTCEKRRGQSVRLAREALYTVIFTDGNGNMLGEPQTIAYGDAATAPDVAVPECSTFDWDKDFSRVTSDLTVNAVWTVIPVPAYSVTSEDNTKGTVTVTQMPASCADLNLSFRADANNGYEFVKWSDGSTDNPRTLTLTQDTFITAIFENSLPLDIILQEKETNAYYDEFAANYNGRTVAAATLNRQFTKGSWATLCLPFNVTAGLLGTLGMRGRVFEFARAEMDEGGNVTLYFSQAKMMKAGQCYIVNPNAAMAAKTSFVFTKVTFDFSADKVSDLTVANAYDGLDGTGSGDITLVGALRYGVVKSSDDGNYYLGLKDNMVFRPNTSTGTKLPAYRGVFRSLVLVNAAHVRIVADGENVTELDVMDESTDKTSSNVNKFIRNGVLFIERNGVIYNAQGTRVR